jgi:DNA-binding transcriptional ArsR family regulator
LEGTVPEDDDHEALAAMRAVAHPLRVRILSLLTGAALSAAEVARELGINHANASYHLRVLREAGTVVDAGVERIRGGVARRYRYPVDAERAAPPPPGTDRGRAASLRAWLESLQPELLRRVGDARGRATTSDLEAWVPEETWAEALDLLHRASVLLHEAALPPRTPGTVHVSATSTAFVMTGSDDPPPSP